MSGSEAHFGGAHLLREPIRCDSILSQWPHQRWATQIVRPRKRRTAPWAPAKLRGRPSVLSPRPRPVETLSRWLKPLGWSLRDRVETRRGRWGQSRLVSSSVHHYMPPVNGQKDQKNGKNAKKWQICQKRQKCLQNGNCQGKMPKLAKIAKFDKMPKKWQKWKKANSLIGRMTILWENLTDLRREISEKFRNFKNVKIWKFGEKFCKISKF